MNPADEAAQTADYVQVRAAEIVREMKDNDELRLLVFDAWIHEVSTALEKLMGAKDGDTEKS